MVAWDGLGEVLSFTHIVSDAYPVRQMLPVADS